MKNLCFLIVMLLSTAGVAQSMQQVKIGPEQEIQLLIPEVFTNMSDQDRMKKSYSSKVPIAMFANETQDATLTINYNIMQWTEPDTDLVYGFYKASINNLFDKVEFLQDTIKQVNGRTFIVLEMIGSIEDDNMFSSKSAQKTYNYILYTSWKEQVLLFNFNCKPRMLNVWKSIAHDIMNSIEIEP